MEGHTKQELKNPSCELSQRGQQWEWVSVCVCVCERVNVFVVVGSCWTHSAVSFGCRNVT